MKHLYSNKACSGFWCFFLFGFWPLKMSSRGLPENLALWSHELRTWAWSKCFTWIYLSNPLLNDVGQVLSLLPFHIWGNWGTRRVHRLPRSRREFSGWARQASPPPAPAHWATGLYCPSKPRNEAGLGSPLCLQSLSETLTFRISFAAPDNHMR